MQVNTETFVGNGLQMRCRVVDQVAIGNELQSFHALAKWIFDQLNQIEIQ